MITYIGGKEAETMFAQTFKSSNFSSFEFAYSAIKMRQHLLDVTTWCSMSPTARKVLEFVNNHEKSVYLVGMKGGFQAFSNDEPTSDGKKVPVIFVDLGATLGARVRGPHEAALDPNLLPTTVPLHNNVAFVHELGHAKQWMERPGFMDGLVNHTSSFANAIQAGAQKHHLKGAVGMPVRGTGIFAQVQFNKAMKGYLANHPVLGGIEAPMAKGWGVRVESDNMFRHEWPVCEEMKLPKRLNYRDLVVT